MRKSLLITGASSGIGAACARLAAERGWDVTINYNTDKAGADAVAADCNAAGAQVRVVQADVSTPEGIAALYAAHDAAFGRIDGLVNNAGMVADTAPVTELTFERMRKLFDLNVIGAILVAKEAVTRMQAQGDGGAIVNISSVAARLGSGNQYVDYAASKAAIDTFTKGLSDEVAAQNIRVNAIRPGLIETPLHEKGGEPGRAQRLAHMVPMKREGSAQEVAEAVLYLLSDEASYVVGTTLDVSGGR